MDLRRLMDTIRNPSRTRVVFPMLLALAAGSLVAADAAPHKQSAPLTYSAVSDLAEHPKPALPDTGPGSASWTVNTIYKDPIFGTRIGRVTDGNTLVGASSDYRSYSFQTTASAEQNTWNTSGTKFYVDTMSGWIVPFAFDPVSMKASRIPDSGSRFGGLVLTGLRGEPAFSFTNPDWIYGVAPTPAGNAIIRYDFAANTYTNLLVVDSLCGGGPRLGAISVSATEVVALECGGVAQNDSRYVILYDTQRAAVTHVLNTMDSTIDGQPVAAGTILGWKTHNAMIDKSGRFVVITSVGQKNPLTIWDVQQGRVYPVGPSYLGHKAAGYGVLINNGVPAGEYGPQYQMRDLAAADTATPKELLAKHTAAPYFFDDSHLSWNNAQPGGSAPVLISTYGGKADAHLPLDGEIMAVSTDGSGRVWRFAHHHSITTSDFWTTPRGNVSQDGRFFLFTSTWENTLGLEPKGKSPRKDVFVVELNRAPADAPAVASVLNSASLADAVAPGSRVSIFGINFGGDPVSAAPGSAPFGLPGVSVAFNGTPAPVLFVDTGRIDAQLPFEIQPGAAQAVVTIAGVDSAPLPFTVASPAPGLFMADSLRALAFNSRWIYNDPSHAAPAGSLVSIFLTGQGQVDPPVATGDAAPLQPFSSPVLPVSVTVGGRNAPVLFAGLGPGSVGILQVNFAVPVLPSGDYAVVVSIGGHASNSGLISVT